MRVVTWALLALLVSTVPLLLRASQPRAFTFSIVARDPATGDLGVAVQSHWFSVGSVVPWAESGVGAVATQSFAEPSYGPLGLGLMRAGKSAPEALKALLAADDGREVRQVAIFKEVFAKEPAWAELTPRLPGVGLLPDDPALLRRIMEQAEKTSRRERRARRNTN